MTPKTTTDDIKADDAFLRDLISSLPYGVAVLDNDGVVKFTNSAMTELSGFDIHNVRTMEDWVEKVFTDPGEHKIIEELWRQIAASADVTENDILITRKDKQKRWCQFRTTRMSNGNIIVTGMDVTDKKSLHEEARRLFAAVRDAAESIIVTDTKGDILYVNPWFEQMTGYTRDEIVGQNTRVLGSGMQDKAFYADLWATITNGKTWRGHFVNKRKDGKLFEENAVISPVLGESGDIVNYVAVKRDVTHERGLENQMQQSQKMAAVGQLAYRIAHDFTNALVVIMGNTQMAIQKALDPSAVRLHLNEVISSANHVLGLTAELLAFANPHPGVRRNIQLGKTVCGIEEMIKRAMTEKVKLSVAVDDGGCCVNVDPTQIEQVIMHLTINACEAMPEGGELRIKTYCADLSAREMMRLGAGMDQKHLCEKKYAVLSVIDAGRGMTPEQKLRVFEPFYSTKEDKKNAGLGLAAVYNIIKQHDGHITVDSIPGQGSTFNVFLPLV